MLVVYFYFVIILKLLHLWTFKLPPYGTYHIMPEVEF
jgi:hypothetical protein